VTLGPLALVREGAAQLAQAGCQTAQLDAEILVAHALETDRTGLRRLSSDPLGEMDEAAARGLLARRAQREPVAQIVGYRWFRNVQVSVDSRVLTPRPETELLVEWGVCLPANARVADIGTGSGAIALALADERPDLQITATDVDAGALSVARENAVRLGLDISFVQGDLLDAVDSELDALISNPPYIKDSELAGLAPEVVDHEPHLALTAGPDGLEVVQRLVEQASLRKIPWIALEIGAGQADQTAALLTRAGWGHVEIRNDLAGIGRVVIGDNSGDRN